MARCGCQLLLLVYLLAAVAPVTAAPAAKPNLLLIFVADMGYADPTCYGGSLVPTPNIDALAAGGVRCTDGYVTSPVCAPSRCGLMTGACGQRFGMQWNEHQYRNHAYRIPDEHKLLPQALAAGGYGSFQKKCDTNPKRQRGTNTRKRRSSVALRVSVHCRRSLQFFWNGPYVARTSKKILCNRNDDHATASIQINNVGASGYFDDTAPGHLVNDGAAGGNSGS